MANIKRFGRRHDVDGNLEIVVWKDVLGNFLTTREGPYSSANPPSSIEFPDWATLLDIVETSTVLQDEDSVDISISMVDDTLNDGTVLVPFVDTYLWDATTEEFVLLSRFEEGDVSTTYTPLGTVTVASQFGVNAKLAPSRLSLVGPTTWSSVGADTTINIKARTISGTTTFTDTNSIVTPIITNEVIHFSADQSDPSLLKSPVTVTVDTGDTVIVEILTLSE